MRIVWWLLWPFFRLLAILRRRKLWVDPPRGNDENLGTRKQEPIRTLREVARRIGPRPKGDFFVYVMDDCPSTDVLNLDTTIARNAQIRFIGAPGGVVPRWWRKWTPRRLLNSMRRPAQRRFE